MQGTPWKQLSVVIRVVPYKLSMGYSEVRNKLSMGVKPSVHHREASVFRGLTVCTVCGSYASSSGEVGSEVEGPLFP